MAEQQTEALADVGAWLSGAGAAEEEMLRQRRARGLPRQAVAPRAGAGAPAQGSAAPLVDPLDAMHEEGNQAMGQSQYDRAVSLYTRVLFGRPQSIAALANRCLAHLKLQSHGACIADATLALRLDPTHIKCWHRRALARNALGQHALALADLGVAHALEPANKTVLAEQRKTAELVKACRRRRPEMLIQVVEE
jgi:tetratricopeptide (TPR) repeat protein